jgi:Tol biopolymer transport system component
LPPPGLMPIMRSMRAAVASIVGLCVVLLVAQRTSAAFPGDNGRIAWTSARAGNPDVYTENADGSDLTQLTTGTSADVDPAWSADGTRIAFTSNRAGNDDIFVMAANGTGQTRITTDPGNDVNPAWSPGGRNIVFASNRDGNAEIFVMNDDGTGVTQLTHTDAVSNAVPAWSPDSSKIAFTSTRDGRAQIYVMNVDGSAQTRLTNDPRNDISPNWSPDGARIAFASNRDGNYEIYSMNADGTDQRRLTTNLETDIDPAWSPDGKKIAFVSNRDANNEIYVTNADGSDQTRFTGAAADDTTPDWQPVPIVPPPPKAVASASMQPRWLESMYRGALVVRGSVPGTARLHLVLRRGTAVHFTANVTLPAGEFRRSFKLPVKLLPGRYLLDVTAPTSATALTPQTLTIILRAPPEGVVSEAWASDVVGGPPLERLPSTTPIAFAQFRFAALPRRGRVLVAHWFGPGYPDLKPRPKPSSRLVITFVNTKNGVPLPSGLWRCMLRAGPTVVKRLAFHIG